MGFEDGYICLELCCRRVFVVQMLISIGLDRCFGWKCGKCIKCNRQERLISWGFTIAGTSENDV